MKRKKNEEHSKLVREYQRIKERIRIYLRRIELDKDFLSRAVFDPWGEYESYDEQLKYLQSVLDDDKFLVKTYSEEARELKLKIKNSQR